MEQDNQNKQKGAIRKRITPEQVQKRKKMVIFPLLFSGFAVAIYFIFMPSVSTEEQSGLNTDLPLPQQEIMGDKMAAYERELHGRKKERQVRSLSDFGIEPDTVPKIAGTAGGGYTPKQSQETSIRSSADAYKSMNHDLNNFYNQPVESAREKELEEKIAELQASLDEQELNKNTVDDQLRLMEESYKMVAKYLPRGEVQNTGQPFQQSEADAAKARVVKPSTGAKVVPVSKSFDRGISALPQVVSDSAFVERYSKPFNAGFHTVGMDDAGSFERNTIRASVHSDQVISNGQNIKLRLLEGIEVGGMVIPGNEVITGIGKIEGERLMIAVRTIAYAGRIIPVHLMAYDTDGQEGVFIPGSLERNAAKEIVANMGRSTGTSISINQQGAAEQLAADLGKNLIQGASQYLSKKMQVAKVNIKGGYRLMLLQKQE